MSALKLLCLEGDGIGPEIMQATLKVFEAVRSDLRQVIDISHGDIGFKALERDGTTLPDAVLSAAKASDAVLLGPVSHNTYPPVSEGGLNPSGVLRKELDLFANIRPAKSWSGLSHPIANPVDLIVVRENHEGFYADRNMHLGPGEFMPVPGIALAIRRITQEASERIAERAFAIASGRSAQKVAAIHKANVMRVSDGLFLDVVRGVAAKYPNVAYEEILVDAAAAHLVRSPDRFDVLVTTNMFGDILSDLASELAGGLGLAGSLNAGPSHAAGQAQHGSAPDIAGKDCANPVSLMLSLAMLLRHFGEEAAAARIETAIGQLLSDPATRTPDLGGRMGTQAFADHVVSQIKRQAA